MSEIQVAVFKLGSEKYSIPIEQIAEIIKYRPITSLPGQPSYMKGVTNIRDKIIPIMNLTEKLSLPISNQPEEEKRILIVNIGEKVMGLIVDSVDEIIKVSDDKLNSAKEHGIESRFISSIINHNNDVVILLDLDVLVD